MRLLSYFTLSSYHIVTTFISLSTFALHNYSPLLRECTFHHMPMHLQMWCVLHSFLTLLGFHLFTVHFVILLFISSFHCSYNNYITYIFVSVTSNICYSYGSIHTSHEASIIIRLSYSYIPKIMWYKTYSYCM